MKNHDETILRGQRIVWPTSWPPLHQALRIALYDEYAARAFYTAVTAAFGEEAPFANIARSEQRHIEALSDLCLRYGVPRPLDPFPAEVVVAPLWRSNLERGVAGEIANIQLYHYLLGQVAEADVRRVFQNLQAASLRNHLPAFQRALQATIEREQYHARQGIPPKHAHVRHGPLNDALERAFSLLSRQHGAFDLAGSLLRWTPPSLVTGMAVGGGAAYLWRNSIFKSIVTRKRAADSTSRTATRSHKVTEDLEMN